MKPIFLLSDVVLMGLISSFTTLASIVIIAMVNAKIKRVQTKLDENIKQMDGHMTKLLEQTAIASKAEGKEERKVEQAPIIEQKVKDAEELGKLKGKEEVRAEIKKENGGENSNQ